MRARARANESTSARDKASQSQSQPERQTQPEPRQWGSAHKHRQSEPELAREPARASQPSQPAPTTLRANVENHLVGSAASAVKPLRCKAKPYILNKSIARSMLRCVLASTFHWHMYKPSTSDKAPSRKNDQTRQSEYPVVSPAAVKPIERARQFQDLLHPSIPTRTPETVANVGGSRCSHGRSCLPRT